MLDEDGVRDLKKVSCLVILQLISIDQGANKKALQQNRGAKNKTQGAKQVQQVLLQNTFGNLSEMVYRWQTKKVFWYQNN